MSKESLQLILVAGPIASGKNTFAKCYKNAFLQSLPIRGLKEGMKEGESFAALSTLSDEDVELIRKAHRKGYRLTVYFLFAGRLLTLLRGRYRQIAEGIPFDETFAKKEYDTSYKGLKEIAHFADLLFLVRNQKECKFLTALEPKKMTDEQIHKTIALVKKAVDTIKEA